MNKAEQDIYDELKYPVRYLRADWVKLVKVEERKYEVFGKPRHHMRYYFSIYHSDPRYKKINPFPLPTQTNELVEGVDLKILSKELGVQVV